MTSGCRRDLNGKITVYTPDRLDEMLEESMDMASTANSVANEYGTNLYNEVLINSSHLLNNLPQSIAAFVYFDDEDSLLVGQPSTRVQDKIVATTAYVHMLDSFNYTERDIPLLRINRTGPHIMDVSGGARKYLANHSLDEYRKRHPFRTESRSRNRSNSAIKQYMDDEDNNNGAKMPREPDRSSWSRSAWRDYWWSDEGWWAHTSRSDSRSTGQFDTKRSRSSAPHGP
jgi:hypothetical protein